MSVEQEPRSAGDAIDGGGVRGGLRRSLRRPAETFRTPHFPAFWSGNLLQFFCFNMNIIANQWLVTSLTSSRTALGLVGFIQGGTIAATSPVSGVAVDRLPKRNLLISGRMALAAAILCIGVLSATGHVALWQIWVESLFVGLVMSLTEPATQTYVFDLVGRERIQNAVALNSMGTGLAQMGGPALAGVLIAVIGITATFFSSTLGFVLSCALFLTIPILGKPAGGVRKSAIHELGEGLAYVRRNPALLLVLISCMAAIFNGAMFAMRPVFARHVLHVGATGYGLMAALGGIGSIVGAVLTAALPQAKRPGVQTVGSMLCFSGCLVLHSFAFSFPYQLGIEFLTGVVAQFWQVSIFSGLQLSVPEELRGRIISLVFTSVQLSFVGQLGVGILADHTSDQFALGLFGALPAVWLGMTLVFGFATLARLRPLHGDWEPISGDVS